MITLKNYNYTDSGLLTTMTYPDGGVHTFDYEDGTGFLKEIGEGSNPFVNKFTYNKSGVVTSMFWENGVEQTWKFDNRKRINRLSISRPDKVIEDLKYNLNSVGDIKSINSNEYKYNGFGEIIGSKTLIPGNVDQLKLVEQYFGSYNNNSEFDSEIAFSDSADFEDDNRINGADHHKAFLNDIGSGTFDNEKFTYDKAGNRLTLKQNEDSYTYEYGVRNQLDTIYKDGTKYVSYKYDKNGNTIEKKTFTDSGTQLTTYKYDTLNRLLESENEKGLCRYSYDNAGNRFVKEINNNRTIYLRQGAIAVAMDIELESNSGNSTINRYVLSGDLIAGRISKENKNGATEIKRSYYHLDHLNSTKVVTDENAEVLVKYEYRAFGEQLKRLNEQNNVTDDQAKYSYGGKELDDENGLYYFNARYYDATTGRFINVDPIQDGTNWYIYCSNNPLNMVDPTGLQDNTPSFRPTYPFKVVDISMDQFLYIYRLHSENATYRDDWSRFWVTSRDITSSIAGNKHVQEFAAESFSQFTKSKKTQRLIRNLTKEGLGEIADVVGVLSVVLDFLPDTEGIYQDNFNNLHRDICEQLLVEDSNFEVEKIRLIKETIAHDVTYSNEWRATLSGTGPYEYTVTELYIETSIQVILKDTETGKVSKSSTAIGSEKYDPEVFE